MVQQEVLCSTCGKPVDQSGSMTQWMFSSKRCTCSEEDRSQRELQLCPLCGLRLKGREGTMTSWIFRSRCCSCLLTDALDRNLDSTALPKSGSIAGDPYEWIAVAGHGGMSTVYKAKHKKLDRLVAVKVIKPNQSDNDSDRFLKEARSASKLSHPNIVSVVDFGLMSDGSQYLAIEWIDGITLSEYLKRYGALSVQATHEIFVQLLDGLSHAHNRAVIHRDIKPSNVMLGRTASGGWLVKLIDFGSAKEVSQDGQVTRAEDMAFSPLYVSPERISGLIMDHRADLYSLGCTLFEALTGRPPFRGAPLAVVMMHSDEKPPSLASTQDNKEFPQYLEDIIAKLLAKSPDDRFQSAESTKHAFERRQVNKAVNQLENENGAVKRPYAMYAACALAVLVCSGLSWNILFGEPGSKERKATEQAPSIKTGQGDAALPLDRGNLSVNATTAELSSPGASEFAKVKPIKNLETIKVIACPKLKGSDLNELACKPMLTRLLLDGCTVDASVLSALSTYPKLEFLTLAGCTLEAGALASLKPLKSLTRLELKYSAVRDAELKEINQLSSLRRLNLDGVELKDESMRLLNGLKDLAVLDVSNNPLTAEGFKYLSCKNTLTNLSMHHMPRLTPQGLSCLKDYRILRDIEFDNNSINAAMLLPLKKMPSLDSLMFPNCRLKSDAYSMLGTFTHLTHTSFSETKTNDEDIKNFAGLKNLRYVNLRDTAVTPAGIAFLKEHLPKLEKTN